jgi:hypothetical protein
MTGLYRKDQTPSCSKIPAALQHMAYGEEKKKAEDERQLLS